MNVCSILIFDAMIRFDNVFKNFDGKQVLAGVSFEVAAGEILAIVGPSGTGKSVTLKHIVGLLTPDSGTVAVQDGARIGYLFQGGALLAWLTVRENVALPLKETTKTETFGSEKNKLLPTDIGIVVTDFLTAHFADILDYNFTARVEKDFDAVAEGKENWTEVIRSFYGHFEPQVAKTMEEKTDKRVGERILGNDPQTGKPVSVKIGRFGPMAQIGDNSDGEKPRFAKLQPSMSLERITLEEALELFKLPRTLGEADGKAVSVGVGRFGPYVRHDKTYASIPKDVDPLSISLEEALQLLAEKREKDAKKHIKKFEEKGIEIMNGRFGPYIAFDGNSYKLPKADAARAAELTEEDCLRIIEEVGKKKKRK